MGTGEFEQKEVFVVFGEFSFDEVLAEYQGREVWGSRKCY